VQAEQSHGFVGEHAVRTPAVSHNLLSFRQFLETRFEFRQRYRACARDVSRGVLLGGPYVQDEGAALPQPALQAFDRHRLQRVAMRQVHADQVMHVGQTALA
jgi:hypothetical protein